MLAGKRLNLAGATAFVTFMAVLPLVFDSRYLIGVLTVSAIYGIWAVSWDFMSGLTGRENFGHSLFIGVGAYTAGFLNTLFGVSGDNGIFVMVPRLQTAATSSLSSICEPLREVSHSRS